MNNKIYEESQKYNTLFFDIFDTLVHRSIEPEHVKKIWASYMVRIFDLNVSSDYLYNLRNKIEAQMCSDNLNKGLSNEFKYNEMISEIYSDLDMKSIVSLKDFTLKCIEIEICIEKKVLYIDADIIKTIKNIKKQWKKKIYCVSDMYFSKKDLKSLLHHLGILDLFDGIYVSSEYMKTKSNGKLYDVVLEDLKLNPNDCLMIGDNQYSDYEMAINKKINALLLDASNYKEDYSLYKNQNSYENVNKKIIGFFNKKPEFIFENMTYSLYLFTTKLYFKLLKKGANKVIFFAREGQFLKKLFDEYQNYVFGPKIDSEYLCVSRASTFLGTLSDFKDEKFSGLFKQYPNMSLRVFLENLYFSKQEILELKKSLKVNFDTKIENFSKSAEFKKLEKNEKFLKYYNDKRKKSKDLFIKYLKQLDINLDDSIYVVDVGWKGTIQNNIQKILKGKKVYGFYLGLVHYENIFNYNKKEAVLFENTVEHKTNNCYLYNSNRSIFEILLAADHGSTVYYDENDKKVIPVFNNQEKEMKLYNNVISKIQDNIYNKFIELLNLLKSEYFDDDMLEILCNRRHFDLMFNPTKAEIKTYLSFYHFENFGEMTYSYFSDNNKIKLKDKIRNYIHLKQFMSNDDSWQFLKLYKCKMSVGIKLLYFIKKRRFKNNNVI